MMTTEITRARKLAMLLLSDESMEQRTELVGAGVALHRILTLYPLDFNNLHPTLNRYLDARGRMRFFDKGFASTIATRDQQLFEGLDTIQRAACHRDLRKVMEEDEAKALWKRATSASTTTYGRIGTRKDATAQHLVNEDHPHLYTALWYLLNHNASRQSEAAKHLLELTDYLLPDLETHG